MEEMALLITVSMEISPSPSPEANNYFVLIRSSYTM